MKCEDCKVDCRHFQSTDYIVDKANHIRQTKLYFRCPKCKAIYVEWLNLCSYKNGRCEKVGDNYHIEKIPYVEKKTTLDNWI